MAQPSVAREPSMEEILASIRRIIESNEPAGEGDARHDFSGYDDESDMHEEAEFAPEMAANDPGMPGRDAQGTRPSAPSMPLLTPQPPVPERSMSLADVAARVRAASGRAPETPDAARPPAALEFDEQPAEPPVLPPIPELGGAGLAQAASMPTERSALPLQTEPHAERSQTAAAPPVSSTDARRTPETPRPPMANAEPAADSRPATLPAKIEAAATLMSAEAGAQVARSFGELEDVLNGIDQQSLEEMAQDMLRPMLQEWLDDNLPTLVERLVREEIERVARGPRR